jgi:hypothetical protein
MTTAEKRLLVRDLARQLFAADKGEDVRVQMRMRAAFARRLKRMQAKYPDQVIRPRDLEQAARWLIATGGIRGPGRDW